MESLMELLEEELKDLYNAENQLLKAMPRMAKKASSETLKQQLEMHREQTEGQVERLEKIAKQLDIKLSGKVCHAMKGLIEEAQEVLKETGDDATLDAALIGATQRVEHYEMAGYGVARTLATTLGHEDIAKLLQETLDEEKLADEKLTEIAEGEVYAAANTSEDEEGMEGEDEEMEEEEAPKARAGRGGKNGSSGGSRGKRK